MARKIAAFVLGVLTLGMTVLVLQQMSALLHPLPEGLDPMDPADAEAFRTHVSAMPTAAWVVAMLSEVVGAFAGALVAGWISRDWARGLSGAVVGLGLLGSVMNWTAFPHPAWFIGAQLVLYPVALVGAWLLHARRPPAEAEGRAM